MPAKMHNVIAFDPNDSAAALWTKSTRQPQGFVVIRRLQESDFLARFAVKFLEPLLTCVKFNRSLARQERND